MTPKRVHAQRGEKLPPNTKLVTRASRFGNPYVVGTPGVPDRDAAVRLFRRGLVLRRQGAGLWSMRDYPSEETIRAELGGYDLACSCPLDDEPCHVDPLLLVANGP